MARKDRIAIGEKYGLLLVIARDFDKEEMRKQYNKQNRKFYVCQCDCGNKTSVMSSNLLNGGTKSCGCLRRARSGAHPKDLSDRTFGSLKVLYVDEDAPRGKGRHRRWTCKCLLCSSIKSYRSSDLTTGQNTDCGCVGRKANSEKHTIDLTGHVFGHLSVTCRDMSVGVKSGRHSRWLCKCNLCGSIESVSSNHLRHNYKDRCHNCCKKSAGEAMIMDIFKENNIQFVHDKPYLDCINPNTNYKFRFDFRVTNSNNGQNYIVEYDGLQHYKPAPMWDLNGDFDERKWRDKFKNEWCHAHDIPIIRIPYKRLKKLCISDLLLETTQFRVT